jgi:hypothetical protein
MKSIFGGALRLVDETGQLVPPEAEFKKLSLGEESKKPELG